MFNRSEIRTSPAERIYATPAQTICVAVPGGSIDKNGHWCSFGASRFFISSVVMAPVNPACRLSEAACI